MRTTAPESALTLNLLPNYPTLADCLSSHMFDCRGLISLWNAKLMNKRKGKYTPVTHVYGDLIFINYFLIGPNASFISAVGHAFLPHRPRSLASGNTEPDGRSRRLSLRPTVQHPHMLQPRLSVWYGHERSHFGLLTAIS